MAEIEQQPRRGGRARHLVHRDDRHHGLSRVVDCDKRYVQQTTVEFACDPVLPGVDENALDALRARERRGRVRAAPFTTVITGSLISVVPLILAFVFLQRYWQSGLGTGGVKAEAGDEPSPLGRSRA